jgi:crossover junction endodeoxyribonuclease RuvC
MTLILGVDPGLQRTGWGIIQSKVNQLSFIACGTITSHAKAPLAERIMALHDGLYKVITLYQPTEAAVEETFMNNNAAAALKLGQARGVVLLGAARNHTPVTEYATRLVIKSVVGTGKAEKEQVQAMLRILLPGLKLAGPDAADALAVAITHAHHFRG